MAKMMTIIIIMSQCMRFPTMWYVRQAKPQISLRIRAVWSEPLLVAWVFYDCLATDWTPFGVSKLKGRLQRLVRVCTFQNVKLSWLINITYTQQCTSQNLNAKTETSNFQKKGFQASWTFLVLQQQQNLGRRFGTSKMHLSPLVA